MLFGRRERRLLWRGLVRLDPILALYCVLTLFGMVQFYDWADPPRQQAGCQITRVVDGDTVALLCDGADDRGRMLGLDAPELSQPQCRREKRAAEAAKQALIAMIAAAQEVRVEVTGQDKYRRRLVRLWLDGQDASLRLIAMGHARPYEGGKRAGWCKAGEV